METVGAGRFAQREIRKSGGRDGEKASRIRRSRYRWEDISRERKIVRASDGGGYLFSGEKGRKEAMGGGGGGGLRFPARIAVHDIGSINK